MWEIILKMLLCLIIAFVLGFIVGWLLRGLFCKEKESKLQADLDDRDNQIRGFRANASVATASASSKPGVATSAVAPVVDAGFENEYSAIRARLDELEFLATDDEEDTDEELSSWTTETDDLRSRIASLKSRSKNDEEGIKIGGLDATALALLTILKKAREDKAAGIAKLRRIGYGDGVRDDLKDILGVGPVLEKVLNGFDVYLFKDIATWDDATVDQMAENLGSFQGGRILREDWVGQCKDLHFKKYGERV